MFFLLQAAGKSSSPGGMLSMLLPFILMFVVMYFLILRPQKRKEKERKILLSRIKKNDRVVTAGGIHGLITSVRENEIILRVDDAKDVKLKIDRSAIVTVLEVSGDDTEEPKELPKESKDTK
ncbi:MAG: preprotein translocase subunit YajC [Planctomycetia bacterium]|jgi:preprotein translocase subunit YajC|uniref:Sec translocon accessory complex subunit YajC n=2 Tax=Candidatus Brocadia sapporoensis TaxID=392547 RepID=A0A1V6LWU0_9BACT|nr:preprotein translocase subunit YajC [Candidatus Brocadia sapporoensis]MCC7238771.1 preprotein translocase subunit YajC [Candidatus Brocadia sp.]OQZ04234.1 MAG: preprotein translocase subunit YajC [Candidatus Brocadia sp. UTAMX1]QOJ07998.1 MAG: preprotein translocase subunit YajC [Planctomycetia bacterium]RZV59471.1 MAG: preprotein translocase subunit YajC [Candidatus Brocadia sp. BROELEC01]TVL98429.1 MAG: preprotein translocase subunit YajC [Candidatus Brocadia sp. BL1]TWU53634.1 preprotei